MRADSLAVYGRQRQQDQGKAELWQYLLCSPTGEAVVVLLVDQHSLLSESRPAKYCCNFLSAAVITGGPKAVRERILSGSLVTNCLSSRESQSRNSRQDLEVVTAEERCLLA